MCIILFSDGPLDLYIVIAIIVGSLFVVASVLIALSCYIVCYKRSIIVYIL